MRSRLLHLGYLAAACAAPVAVATPGPGRPDRAPDLDALPGFHTPPPGYGQVAFYWWLGDPLTKERLTWQLDRLTGIGVSGLQINYAHSDKGGPTYGLTHPSEPALFSEEWWSLVQGFAGEAGRRGMAVSLSDYTLGIGQGWVLDDALKAHPEIAGAELKHEIRDAPLPIQPPEDPVSYQSNARLAPVAKPSPSLSAGKIRTVSFTATSLQEDGTTWGGAEPPMNRARPPSQKTGAPRKELPSWAVWKTLPVAHCLVGRCGQQDRPTG